MQYLALLLRASPKLRQPVLRASESSAAAQDLLTWSLHTPTLAHNFACKSTACSAAYLRKSGQLSLHHLAGLSSV